MQIWDLRHVTLTATLQPFDSPATTIAWDFSGKFLVRPPPLLPCACQNVTEPLFQVFMKTGLAGNEACACHAFSLVVAPLPRCLARSTAMVQIPCACDKILEMM